MPDKTIVEKRVDVLVMGGSASGMPAALRAKENGAESVLLIDKRPVLGGCCVCAKGFFAVETPAQKRMGIHLTADECFKEYCRFNNWRFDARIVRQWFRSSGKVAEWLEDHGCVVEGVDSFNNYKGKRIYHRIEIEGMNPTTQTGLVVMRELEKRMREEGIEILLNTRGNKLVTDENGNVVGAVAFNEKENTEYHIHAGAVILCTGSITGNPERVKHFFPFDNYEGVWTASGTPFNSGDGYFMARELGAKETTIGALRMGPHSHRSNERVNALVRRAESMYVNQLGERYTDETLYSGEPLGWFAGESLDVQPFKRNYVIYDTNILENVVRNRKNIYGHETGMAGEGLKLDDPMDWFDHIPQDMEKAGKKGEIGMFETLEECADYIGCDRETFIKSVERYNEACKVGYDDEFLKDPEYLIPINKAPYYVIQGFAGIDTFLGGVKVDHYQRVLREDWTPIKGLYMAGTGAGGWVNTGYGYPGTCFGYSLYSGWYAGKEAADYAAANK